MDFRIIKTTGKKNGISVDIIHRLLFQADWISVTVIDQTIVSISYN